MKDEKHIILGVSFSWSYKKGIDVFVELADALKDNYLIVLVGVGSSLRSSLPSNIISIEKTDNAGELAKIYSAADVLVNPTREDNYPTINMEAIACGIPVIVFDTGGSKEAIDNSTGKVVCPDDIDSLIIAIEEVCEKKSKYSSSCIAASKKFDINKAFEQYTRLYIGK